VNKEIEVVKNNIQELSNLATLGNLLSLETNLKQYADNSIPDLSDYATKDEFPDSTDYATKEEIPDLSNYATKNEIPDLSDYATKEEIPDLTE
jgi:hypothetical protein